MALADILTRIDADTRSEVEAILSAAQESADQVVAEAEARAASHRAEVAEKAAATAAREADTIVVNGRLAARDTEVAARRALIDEALAQASEAFAALPDAEYAAVLARYVVAAARGGETLRMGEADAARTDALLAEVRTLDPSLALEVSRDPAPFARGALLEGSRVRVDLSLSALIEERREDLEIAVARVLFPEGA